MPTLPPLAPYPLPAAIRRQVLALAAGSDVLLIGELHGSQEVPRLIAGLLDDLARAGYGALGLEVPADQRDTLEAWARDERATPPAFFDWPWYRWPWADGRGNWHTLALVRQAVGTPLGWRLLCFDTPQTEPIHGWVERDRGMAEQLLAQWQKDCSAVRVVAVCGNLHARLRLDPPVFPACWPSFANQLQQRQPGLRVHALNVAFQAGLVVNVGWRPAGRRWLALPAPARLESSAAYTFTLRLPHATPARLGGCRQPGRAGR